MNGINEMRQDVTSERELQRLKLKVDRWWSDPRKWRDELILNEQEISTLHELLFAAGLNDPAKGTT